MSKSKLQVKKVYLEAGSIFIGGLIIALSIYFIGGGNLNLTKTESVDITCSGDSRLEPDCFPKYAKDLGLNVKEFNKCIEDKKFDDVIASEISSGEKYGVQGTPSIYVGKGKGDEFQGFLITGTTYDEIKKLVEKIETTPMEDIVQSMIEEARESLNGLDEMARDYFASEDGGGLVGEELEQQVANVVSQQTEAMEEYVSLMKVRTLSIGDGVVEGDGDIVLMEFSDYECPYCQQFAQSELSKIKDDLVKNGKIRYVFRDFPLEQIHPKARDAANAARCAGDQGKYFEYHNVLFEVK